MAKRKKSGSGGVVAVLVIGVLALLAAIPREVWVGVAVLAAIGIAFYLYNQSKKASAVVEEPEQQRRASRPAARQAPAASPAPRFVANDEPVSVSQAPVVMRNPAPSAPAPAPFVSNFKVPTAPKGFGAATWVPAGQLVNVSGVTIPGGMVYVGTSLSTPLGASDPCLIDPSKSVARQGDYTAREMGYWPSYSEISPSSRRAYLNWLAGGRKDPEADVGYVFLFFYGLERRAIIDGAKDEAAQADWPVIAAELRRLLAIYGEKSHSFRRYASELLDWVSLASHPSKLYEKPVPSLTKTMELPIYIRLALGQAAVDGVLLLGEELLELLGATRGRCAQVGVRLQLCPSQRQVGWNRAPSCSAAAWSCRATGPS